MREFNFNRNTIFTLLWTTALHLPLLDAIKNVYFNANYARKYTIKEAGLIQYFIVYLGYFITSEGGNNKLYAFVNKRSQLL
jgi:hypothetical protein